MFGTSTQTEERGPTARNHASYHPPPEKATFSYFGLSTQTDKRGPTARNHASYRPPPEKATFSYFGPTIQTEERFIQLWVAPQDHGKVKKMRIQ